MAEVTGHAEESRVKLVKSMLTVTRENLTAEVVLEWRSDSFPGRCVGFNPNESLARATLNSMEGLCGASVVGLYLVDCWEYRMNDFNRAVVVQVRMKEIGKGGKPEMFYGMSVTEGEPIEPAPVKAVLSALNRWISDFLERKYGQKSK